MGWISTVFVHKALNAACDLGIADADARATLFRLLGVDPSGPVDPAKMISDTDFFGLLERIDAMSPLGRSVPIRMGAAMRCDDYGAFGLAFKSAPDLRASYARVERFGKVVTSIANFRVVTSGSALFMEVIQGPERRLGLIMTNELAVAAATAISREVSQSSFVPETVHLMAPRPADLAAYEAYFQCPIVFGADRDAIELSARAAGEPNRLSDDGMSRFFEAHLDRELGQAAAAKADFKQRVLDQIGDALSEGVPTLADAADRLGLSSRTLQRRLSDEGLAYQDLVVAARKSLSEQLLRRTDYALAEIAFLTGFSDQSAFTRAFKRWHGQTPARYRRP